MLLNALTNSIIGKLAHIPLRPAVDFLETLFADRKAFAYAQETLRSKFEPLIRPADYDFVTTNFLLTKQDFIDYFRSLHAGSAGGLDVYVKSRLSERASLWCHNRPTDVTYAQMVDEFYEAYLRYYYTTDPLLSGLHIGSITKEIRDIVHDLRASVARLEGQLGSELSQNSNILASIQVILRVNGIAYNLIEECKDHIDFVFADPMSILPVTSYRSVK